MGCFLGQALKSALEQMGHTADQLSLIAAEQVEKEQMSFEEPVIDYIQMLGAVKEAIGSRQQVRKAYFNAVGDVEAKTAALEKLEVRPCPPTFKMLFPGSFLCPSTARPSEGQRD